MFSPEEQSGGCSDVQRVRRTAGDSQVAFAEVLPSAYLEVTSQP